MTPAHRLALIGVAACVAIAGCAPAAAAPAASTSAASKTGGVATIKVAEQEFKIEPDATTAAAGSTTFEVKNTGTITHEFVVLRTDASPASFKKDDDGTVAEDSGGSVSVDEIEDIAAGSTESLTVSLAPGNYLLMCNLPGHFLGGMATKLTITGG